LRVSSQPGINVALVRQDEIFSTLPDATNDLCADCSATIRSRRIAERPHPIRKAAMLDTYLVSMAVLHHSELAPHTSSAPRPRRVRFGAIAVVLAATGLAALGLAKWILPGGDEAVAYKTWQGPQAHAVGRDTQVATTSGEWQTLWSSLRNDPAPAFDPARQTGVAILLGQRPTPGYQLAILGTEQRGERLIVVVAERRPPDDSLLPQRMTSPYAILLINRSGALVSVEQRVRD
jgi:hypothetical protein